MQEVKSSESVGTPGSPPELSERIVRLIRDIKEDNLSGSVRLALRAIGVLEEYAAQNDGVGRADFTAGLARAAGELTRAQPSMAALYTAANEVRRAVVEAEGAPALALARACSAFRERLERAQTALGARGAELIQEGDVVMTHSASAGVIGAFLEARRRGRRFEVICTESRPMREGIDLARELARADIPVRVIIDAAQIAYLAEASLALVGADSVSRNGLVNKMGTHALALACRETGRALHALCGTEKFLPPGRVDILEEKVGAEILPEAIPGVRASNRYFDCTPLDLFASIITEEGAFLPAALIKRLDIRERGAGDG